MARKEQEQFDPYELGARNSDPLLGVFRPLPPAPKRFKPMQLLVAFLGLVLVIAFVQEGTTRNVPRLAPSCSTAGFSFDKLEIRQGGVVKWSVVGPAASKVVFGISGSAPARSGVPATREEGKLAGPVPLAGCAATGRFGVQQPEGDYTVTAYAIAADGTVTSLGIRKLTVNRL